ncbi:MAG: hypothetical protein ABFS18_12040 [Thermodesulfobacteriota bacterium]
MTGGRSAARLALDIAVSLAQGRACKAAVPFLRFAEKNGLSAERMEAIDIFSSFFCESKMGDVQKALDWWDLMRENNLPVTEYLLVEKVALDIKLGVEPPPVYGKLPSR